MVEYWKDRAPTLETTSLLCFISQLLLGEERGIPSGGEKPNKCYQCDFASSLGQVIWRLIQEHTHYRQLPCFVLSLEQLLPGTPSALFPSFLDVNVLVIFSKCTVYLIVWVLAKSVDNYRVWVYNKILVALWFLVFFPLTLLLLRTWGIWPIFPYNRIHSDLSWP